jgi:hypothetical protein
MKNHLLILSLLAFSPTLFAGRTDIAESDNKVTKPGVISLYAHWVKDKGKKYDIGYNMKNEHDKGIIVLLSEVHCYRGSSQGQLKHTFFNTGERTINFGAGELKSFNLVCQLGAENKGEYKITVGNVYENASGDGKTMGKVLAKDVVWKVKIAD